MKIINKINRFLNAFSSAIVFNKLKIEYKKIVFYAEDIQSQNYFGDLLFSILNDKNQHVSYLTSDANDNIFSKISLYPNLHVFFIGSGLIRTWTFVNLRADLMIMTMPDLETFHIKRSRIYNVHYLYIFHALVSTHSNYRKEAFNNFDTIFCVGEHQIREIRANEKINKLDKKNIYRDNYRPLEYLEEEAKKYKSKGHGKTQVLIAPTWGENNILSICGKALIYNLLESNLRVVLRPHPMTLRNNKDQILELEKTFACNLDFTIQKEVSTREVLFESNLLITDWSGIGLEFGLGLNKPVIYIDVPKKVKNPDYELIGLTPIEITVREEIGKIIAVEDLSNIGSYVKDLMRERSSSKLNEVRKKYSFQKLSSLDKATNRVVRIANASKRRNLKISKN